MDINEFISKCTSLKMTTSPYTFTENGAITPKTSGNILIDQFGKCGSYRNRKYSRVAIDMKSLCSKVDIVTVLRFVLYLRLITRQITLPNGSKTKTVQKGQGSRDEALKRLLYMSQVYPDITYNNIWLLPIVGSWKDIWTLMLIAEENNIGINKGVLFSLLSVALKSKSQCDFIKKYMPRIKTKSNIHSDRANRLTTLAKEFASYMGLTIRQYNKLKSSGNAHDFQKIMCQGQFEGLNWDKIPGIALSNIVSATNILERHNLEESYVEWLSKQDIVKFNGYPYELYDKLSNICIKYNCHPSNIEKVPLPIRKTFDLQFENLLKTARQDNESIGNVLCALDTSGSMNTGPYEVMPISVSLSLGMYFSSLNKGAFCNKVLMFDSNCELNDISGSFTEKFSKIERNAMGSTNFDSILHWMVKYRKEHQEESLDDFPTTLLVVSDMQFDPTQVETISDRCRKLRGEAIEDRYGMTQYYELFKTPYERIKAKLSEAFPQSFIDKMKFIWWNVNGSHETMPATIDDSGCYFFSGYDGAIVSLLLGTDNNTTTEKKKISMEEVITNALNQEILSFVK